MAGGLVHEGLVENVVGVLEPCVDVADLPTDRRVFEQRHAAGIELCDLGLGDLHLLNLRWTPDVAFGSWIRPAGPQRQDRIDDERQRLVLDFDLLDRIGCRDFVDGSDRDNRLTLIERLSCERDFRKGIGSLRGGFAELHRLLRLRNILAGNHRQYTGHRERCARIDAPDPRVRHRAEQELREQHAVRAEIFGILGAARHLRHEIGQHVILPDEFVLRIFGTS